MTGSPLTPTWSAVTEPRTSPPPGPAALGALAAVLALTGTGGGALAARLLVSGSDGVRSVPAGLTFALLLAGASAAAGWRTWTGGVPVRRDMPVRATSPGGAVIRPAAPQVLRPLGLGLVVGAALCLVPLLVHLRTPGPALGTDGLAVWAAVVTAVAVAEEVFFRGSLWNATQALAGGLGGQAAALTLTTLEFAVLHVPLYGTGALPLDLAVGLALGMLRVVSGGWAAPAVAHTVADLAGWWLR